MDTQRGANAGEPGAATAPDLAPLVGQVKRRLVPGELTDAFADPYDPFRPDPVPGQVWRLEWDGTVALAALLHVEHDLVRVVPVGDDPEFADPATVICAESSPVGYPIGVWVALERAVPRVVLDVALGALSAADFDLVEDVREKLRRGRDLPDDRRLGARSADGLVVSDPRVLYRARLEEPIAHLSDVLAVLEPSDSSEEEPEDAQQRSSAFGLTLLAGDQWPREAEGARAPTIGELLKDAGVTADEARESLGLDRNDYVTLLRGDLPITAEEADILASLTRQPVAELASLLPTVDPELLVCLHEPRYRREVESKARAERTSHVDARRDVVREVAGARRRERGGGRTHWRKILDDYFGSG